jgi:hypothetical protein
MLPQIMYYSWPSWLFFVFTISTVNKAHITVQNRLQVIRRLMRDKITTAKDILSVNWNMNNKQIKDKTFVEKCKCVIGVTSFSQKENRRYNLT